MTAKEYYKSTRMVETRNWTLEMTLNFAEEYAEALRKDAVSGSLTHIPIFQYNATVYAHKNTLDLLRIIQGDKKELKLELEAAYKEINRLRDIINYH